MLGDKLFGSDFIAMAKAKKKVTKKTEPKTTKPEKSVKSSKPKVKTDSTPTPKLTEQLKLSESYISLVLGAVVVIAVSAIVFIFIKESRRPIPQPHAINERISPVLSRTPQNIHVMEENETLWDVAVKYYGDGFRYVEIIKANKLENPDFVPPGTKIIIPNAQ